MSTVGLSLDQHLERLDVLRMCRRLAGIMNQVGNIAPKAVDDALQITNRVVLACPHDAIGAPQLVAACALMTVAREIFPAHVLQEAAFKVQQDLTSVVIGYRQSLAQAMAPAPAAPDDEDDETPSPGMH